MSSAARTLLRRPAWRWWMAWAWAMTLPLPMPVANAAGPSLPQRNLSIEARIVEQSAAERQALASGGSVVVGTGGSTVVNGSVTLRAGSDTGRSDSVQRVLVLNGGRATLRLSQLTPLRSVEWLWAGPGIGAGIGIAERTTWVDVGRGLEVRPAWPGGSQPVRVDVAIDGTAPGAAVDAGSPRLAVQTQVSLALGEWVPVAQLLDDSSGGNHSGGVGASTRTLRRELSLQLRVTVP